MFKKLLIILTLTNISPVQAIADRNESGQTFVSTVISTQAVSAQVPNRDEVMGIFRKAVKLNEEFKHMLNKMDTREYNKMRTEIEHYNEEVLSPKLVDAVTLLSSGTDMDLAIEFLNLLISYENSADEQLPYSLGEIYLNNPNLVEDAFTKFEKSKQKLLLNRLEWGFENVIYGQNKSDHIIIDRVKRLQKLKFKVEH